MYDFETDPPTRRRGSFHGPEDMRADLSGRYTLLSREFYYFGGSPVEVPEHLRPVIHRGRAHKWRENSPHVQEFETWIREFDPGLSGMPHQASQFVTIGRR